MLIGRVTGFEVGKNRENEDDDVILLQVEMEEDGDIQTVELFGSGGRDYVPPIDSKVVVLDVSDAMQIAVAVSDGVTPDSDEGEIDLYSVEQFGGPRKARVKLLANGSLELNNGGPAAARVGDTIKVDATTDPALFAWFAAVGTATGTTPPTSITGKITTGSGTVEIGD